MQPAAAGAHGAASRGAPPPFLTGRTVSRVRRTPTAAAAVTPNAFTTRRAQKHAISPLTGEAAAGQQGSAPPQAADTGGEAPAPRSPPGRPRAGPALGSVCPGARRLLLPPPAALRALSKPTYVGFKKVLAPLPRV